MVTHHQQHEESVRLTSTRSMQALGSLLHHLDKLYGGEIPKTEVEKQEAIYELQRDLKQVKSSYTLLSHEVDCLCQNLINYQ